MGMSRVLCGLGAEAGKDLPHHSKGSRLQEFPRCTWPEKEAEAAMLLNVILPKEVPKGKQGVYRVWRELLEVLL